MMYDNQAALNPMINAGVSMVNSGFKVGGEIAKACLLAALEQIRENKQNKVGLTCLKNLARSKDELNILNLKKENLDFFKQECKRLNIPFGAVKNQEGNLKIIYKTKDVNLVKDVLSSLLAKEKDAKLKDLQQKSIYDNIEKNMDFGSINDICYRKEVMSIDSERATALGHVLKANGVENDIVARGINEDNTLDIHYKFNNADKDKAIQIIDANKNKTIEELVSELEKLNYNKDIVANLKKTKEKEKEPLDKQIEKAEKARIQTVKKEKSRNKDKSKEAR